MIVESLVELFFSMLSAAFAGFEIINLPMDTIEVLTTITCYGVWVVGADILAIFTASVLFWWSIKFTVGLLVWLWELLPMT